MLIPILKGYFGNDATYSGKVTIPVNDPEVMISQGAMNLDNFKIVLDLYGTNSTAENTHIVTMNMGLSTSVMGGV